MKTTLLAIENIENTQCAPFYLIFNSYTSCRQMLENGFFHADPHAGNLLAMPSGIACIHSKAHTHTLCENFCYKCILHSFLSFEIFFLFFCISLYKIMTIRKAVLFRLRYGELCREFPTVLYHRSCSTPCEQRLRFFGRTVQAYGIYPYGC